MEQSVRKLERGVADLIKLAENLRHENNMLRKDQRALHQELQSLREKNSFAKGRVDQIVARLKSLEA